MKRLALLLMKLYPRKWRSRYGREFKGLIEDSTISWTDLIDMMMSIVRMQMERSFAMAKPRVIELKDREVAHGYDYETVVEFPRADGSLSTVTSFEREIDLGDSYVRISHSSRDSAPAQTIVVLGTKGFVSGDHRTDQTEMLVLNSDGTVRRTEQTVMISLPYEKIRQELQERYRQRVSEGMTPDEIFQKFQLSDRSF